MKKIKYLLFLIPFLFNINVFASDQNINSTIRYPYNGSSGTYRGLEIYNTGTAHNYSLGTRYNGQLSRIEFYTNYSFESDKTYTITLNMATEDWRNHFMGPQVYRANSDGSIPSSATNWATSSITYVSYKKIKFTFKPTGTMGPLTYFNIYSSNVSSISFTGVNNWNLSSITLSSSTTSTPTPVPVVTATPVPTSNNSDIINNQNQNTSDIINNQNQNSSNIINNQNQNNENLINNQNQNTSDIIENNNSNAGHIIESVNDMLNICIIYNVIPQNLFEPKTSNGITYTPFYDSGYLKYISVSGTSTSTSFYNYVLPQDIVSNGSYWLFGTRDGAIIYVEDYNGNRIVGNANIPSGFVIHEIGYRIASGVTINQWLYPMLKLDNSGKYYPPGIKSCDSRLDSITNNINNTNEKIDETNQKIDETNQKLDDLNNTLTDDTSPSIDLELDTASLTPVSDLIVLPLSLLNKIYDSVDLTCTPYVLPFDFTGGNNTITFPCINLQEKLGTNTYNIIDYFFSFFLAYNIAMMCVSIFNDITSLRDDFDVLYQPQHEKPITRRMDRYG